MFSNIWANAAPLLVATGAIFWLAVIALLLVVAYEESARMIRCVIFTYRLRKAGVFETLKAKHKYRFFTIRLWWSLYRHPRRVFADSDDNLIWYPGTTMDDKIHYHRRESYHPINTEGFNLDKLEGGIR